MRILYVASAVEAGGTSGGSTHVQEVASGLHALGHDVLVIARPPLPRSAVGSRQSSVGATHLDFLSTWPPKELALLGLSGIAQAFRRFRPQAVMERFYNFAGAGVGLAHRARIPALLEVNAPMVDPPDSPKSRLDRLLFGTMRRWAVRQARWSAAIVTPLHTTVPPAVPRRKIHELPWGANVEHFNPAIRHERAGELRALRLQLGLPEGVPVVAFLGSFRAWHGVGHFAEAARCLIGEGHDLAFLAIGGGPELEPLRERVAGWGLPADRLVFAGAQPHERVPLYLALADIGVAPFDLAAHPPLTTFGFYWSPLKVFEYMAMALPVVTVDVPPLNNIVREGEEGCLYPSGYIDGLTRAIARLGADLFMRERLGNSGRARVSAHYSWEAHCRALDTLLRKMTSA